VAYRYENIAAALLPISQIKNPQEGDRARSATGVILVFKSGRWIYG
jgi:hypothetical protein